MLCSSITFITEDWVLISLAIILATTTAQQVPSRKIFFSVHYPSPREAKADNTWRGAVGRTLEFKDMDEHSMSTACGKRGMGQVPQSLRLLRHL